VKNLLKATGQIPVERAGANRANPLTTAALVASRGSGVIVYPEGTLTRDPGLWPMRGKTGAVRLALGADIPLVPAAHWGTERFLPPYGRWLRIIPRQHITVRFGEPVDLSDLRGLDLEPAVVTEATDRLMAAITALVADLRAETAPTERWDPAAHNQTEFGHP
jgi:1-acyl-sn-glycerol-3-phosphate acyltransferase